MQRSSRKRGNSITGAPPQDLPTFENKRHMNTNNYSGGHRNASEEIEAVVDTGANNHVGPANVAPRFPVMETQASLSGDYFTGADGSKMRNLGWL